MGVEVGLMLVVLAGLIFLFALDRLPVEVVALSGLIVLLLAGLLTIEEALSGFSNPVVVALGGIFVLSAALYNTGVADRLGELLLRAAAYGETLFLLALLGVTALLSAFMNNTPAVAVLLPAVTTAARRTGIAPSRLLMPLAFGAVLGGMLTLIGTAPNVLVSEVLGAAGHAPFGLFDFTLVGGPVVLAGIAFLLVFGRRLLPTRSLGERLRQARLPEDLLELYRLPGRMAEIHVAEQSRLAGRTLNESRLGREYGLTVLEIRPSSRRARSRNNGESLQPGDRLLVQGRPGDLARAASDWGFTVQEADPQRWQLSQLAVLEATLAPRSNLVGRTLRELNFRERYGANVLALWRGDRAIRSRLGEEALRVGDALLLEGPPARLELLRDDPDFVVLAGDQPVGRRRQQALWAVTILVAMLAAVVSGQVPLAIAAMTAALALVLTGCIAPREAYRAVEWPVIFLVAGILPLGLAMQRSGAAEFIAITAIEPLAARGDVMLVLGVLVATTLLAVTTSSVAAAALMAPLILEVASVLGAAPAGLLMAVAIGASTAFATPIAHPVNLLVMGPGNYRFADYLRLGLPLTVLVIAIAAVLLPIFWPL